MKNILRTYTAKHLGKAKRQIAGICLHDTAGSGKINDVKYLANPSDGRVVSVDFCVTREGEIYQLNPDLKNNFCYHAGRATKFKGYRNAACNQALIGIEIVQKAKMDLLPLYPDAQVKAAAELCAFLCREFDLKTEDVTTHARIITDGSRSDPRSFPFENFWYYFKRAASGDGDLNKGKIHIVERGDTLYSLSKRYQTTVEELKSLNDLNAASNVIQIGQKLIVKK